MHTQSDYSIQIDRQLEAIQKIIDEENDKGGFFVKIIVDLNRIVEKALERRGYTIYSYCGNRHRIVW